MRLKLDGLQHVVKRVLSEDRFDRSFCDEVSRALGPALVTEGNVGDVAREACELLDAMQFSRKDIGLSFKTSVMVKMLEHRNSNVRAFATRVAPLKFIERSINDRSYDVVVEAAKRLSSRAAKIALRRFPNDELLESIRNEKLLAEDGIKQPKTLPLELNIHGDERLGDAGKQQGKDGDLSDQWYETKAAKLFHDYGRAMEQNWEEKACHAYCANVKLMSGVEIDEEKLLDAVKKHIEEHEDRVLERDALKESLSWLDDQQRMLVEQETSAFPLLSESADPIEELLSLESSTSEFLAESCKAFNVDAKEPLLGTLPSAEGLRSIDERALDRLCRSWEAKNPQKRLQWNPHPGNEGVVKFRITSR